MVKKAQIQAKKIMIIILFIGVGHIAMGSFTGSTEKTSKNIYSLKEFNKTFYKSASLFSVRAGFQYKGTKVVDQKKDAAGLTINSMMRYEKGNTTYIYPYKHTVNVPKFKTPAAPAVR